MNNTCTAVLFFSNPECSATWYKPDVHMVGMRFEFRTRGLHLDVSHVFSEPEVWSQLFPHAIPHLA